MQQIYLRIKNFVNAYFDLRRDKVDNSLVYDSIVAGIEFRGTNLWVLIFAIFVASLGLNMNSVPVIIGAMLISPLMGPIMGIGLGLGVIDPPLISRSFKNLAVATLFGMLTSCLYFLISPIDEARSELLARTNPTIYDVLIAFFGGMAGIIATGSKEKGNVIPGVAIATALMPPLCTSGYGLATGQMHFFFGAFYLYMINCVYIGFATWLGTRILRLPKRPAPDMKHRQNLVNWISALVLVTALPSIYLTYQMVRENILIAEVNNFVSKEFDFPQTQVLNKQVVVTKNKTKILEVSLIGESVPQDSINIIISKMPLYGLEKLSLRVVQGYTPDQKALNSTILQDLMTHNRSEIEVQRKEIQILGSQLRRYTRLDSLGTDIAPEMKIFFPQIKDIAVASTYLNSIDTTSLRPLMIVIAYTDASLDPQQRLNLEQWLSARLQSSQIKLIIERR